MYYWAPDSLEWEPMKIGFTDFFIWALSARLAQFYGSLRWPAWREDIGGMSGDTCFGFYPFLWAREGSVTASHREPVPVREAYDMKVDLLRQLNQNSPESGASPMRLRRIGEEIVRPFT